MKVALLLGVEIHVNTSFDGLIEPPTDQSQSMYIREWGWGNVNERKVAILEVNISVNTSFDGLTDHSQEKLQILHKVTPPL